MNVPDYVPIKEVRRICKELKIRDWTRIKKAKVQPQEARKILSIVNRKKMKIPLEDFRVGLEVELEHGVRFPEANVTNNHPVLTGKIVLAHFNESLDYYKRLDVAELEGDLLHAIAAGNTKKIKTVYKKLAQARTALSKGESAQLK